MKTPTRAIAGLTLGILALVGSSAIGQKDDAPGKRVEGKFVTTVGTHVICDGNVTVSVYEQKGKLNFRANGAGPVPPLIEKSTPWFVYAKSADEIWAFVGHGTLFFYESTTDPNSRNQTRRGIYEVLAESDFEVGAVRRIADKVPQAVRDRLPDAFRAKFLRDVPGAAPAPPIKHEPPVQKVLTSEIGKRVQIVGLLGYPLGELVTIRGTWVQPRWLPGQPPKDNTPSFSVTSVNGKLLKTPVDFYFFSGARGAAEIPRWEGTVWEVRGCETGGFRGTPRQVRDDVPRGPNPPVAIAHTWSAYEFKFHSEFIYSSSKKIE
jgi:hypothetical protein